MRAFIFTKLFIIVMGGMGIISLALLLVRKQADPMLTGLESLLVVYCGAAFLWARSKRIDSVMILQGSLALYLICSWLYAVVYRQANVLDFLMIYKSFVYLFLLTFLTDKRLMTARSVVNFYTIVYEENNFELMLLYALFLVRYSITSERYLLIMAVLAVITLLSLSRSSLLMYSVLVLYVFIKSFPKTWVFMVPVASVILGLAIYYIFSQRSGSLEEIDRYKFMLVFWSEVKGWNAWQWLAGNERITPLSYYSCADMSYFKRLFSYSGDGTCYSVVLHSFLLRVILDHGLLGLVFIIYATWLMLRKSGMQKDAILVFIAIVVINGLSVSSFNNLFFAISMVFLMTTNVTMLKRDINADPESG
jgi:hypothetical protein